MVYRNARAGQIGWILLLILQMVWSGCSSGYGSPAEKVVVVKDNSSEVKIEELNEALTNAMEELAEARDEKEKLKSQLPPVKTGGL